MTMTETHTSAGWDTFLAIVVEAPKTGREPCISGLGFRV